MERVEAGVGKGVLKGEAWRAEGGGVGGLSAEGWRVEGWR